MRTQHLFTFYLVGLLTLVSCNSSIVEKRATGLPYEILVVMTREVGDSEVGDLVKNQLKSPIAGLPQPEPAMRVTFVPTETFNGLLRYVRNILVVDIDPTKYTMVSLNGFKDEWAKGQEVIKLCAPSTRELVTYLTLHDSDIVNHFCAIEKDRRIKILKEHYSQLAMDKVQEKFGMKLHAPDDMTYYKDTTDFLWVSNNAKTGRVDLIVYSFPYTDANTFTQDYLVAKRDSVLKDNLPGAFPDSYMTTVTVGGDCYFQVHGDIAFIVGQCNLLQDDTSVYQMVDTVCSRFTVTGILVRGELHRSVVKYLHGIISHRR